MQIGLRTALVVGAALGLSACASVTRGTKQSFFIQSEPAGGEVTISTGQKCVTPCKLKLKRKTEFDASIALAGYKPGKAHVDSSVSAGGVGGTAGNILLGGVIGIVVDGSSGAMLDLKPNPLKWLLAAEDSADETKIVPGQKPREGKTPAAQNKSGTSKSNSKRTEPVAVDVPADAPS